MYDLAIIGGGPAGYSAALKAVELGLHVVLFENNLLGGTCLNRGCVPTKFLEHTARVYSQMQNSSTYGIFSDNLNIDYLMTMRRKDEIVLQLRTNLEQLLLSKKIEIIGETAQIVKEHIIEAAGKIYKSKNILIATGSVPLETFVEGAITSDEILRLDFIPKTLKIIGGGVVAVEFADIFNALGTKVTLCLRSERMLRKWDGELAMGITQSMKKKGIVIIPNCSVEKMQKQDAEVILSATGRIPNLEGVFSEPLGVDIKDGIIADEYGRTNIPGIFAAGDVIEDSPQLAHIGMEQGERVAEYIAGMSLGEPSVPTKCIYIHPEVASVGLTEAEAKGKNIPIITGKQTMYSNARTIISTNERGFIKIIADKHSFQILGAQLMCERASDIAGELALAINNKMTAHELVYCVHPHPSYCEVISEASSNLLKKGNL